MADRPLLKGKGSLRAKGRSYLWNKKKDLPDSNYKREIKGKNKDGTLKLGKKKRLKRV